MSVQQSLKIDDYMKCKQILKSIRRLVEIWTQLKMGENGGGNGNEDNLSFCEYSEAANEEMGQIQQSIQQLIINNSSTQTIVEPNTKKTITSPSPSSRTISGLVPSKNLSQIIRMRTSMGNTMFDEAQMQQNNSMSHSPESNMGEGSYDAIGDALYRSLKSGGFNFLVDFNEIIFDPKLDYIGGGGYGDVYQGKWLGVKVAIKKFDRKYLDKNANKDFIKEIEIVHSLRHPNIILYIGVSFDHN